jgi:dihydrofolate synthase/folylpolyglutamate synthase
MLTFQEAEKCLLDKQEIRGMQFGLERMINVSALLGNPHTQYPSIHIAGTNGKGSVSLKIAKALEASGLKVGLYTSPHLHSFRERMSVNGMLISEEAFSALMEGIPSEELSFFELTTILAFEHFRREQVDIAVIETGLGGRLDATNLITPLLSVITSIAYDHTAILGNSLEEIAAEKAGIIKSGVPVVIGPRAEFQAIVRRAEKLGCDLHRASRVEGFYDLENQQIARTALEVLQIEERAIQQGLQHRPPCRFQEIDGVIFDVAHNPDGFSRLVQALEIHYPGRAFRCVVGFSVDKEIPACLQFLEKASHLYLVQAPSARGAPVEMLERMLRERGYLSFSGESSIASAVQKGKREARAAGELLVVCGTFFIMPAALSM